MMDHYYEDVPGLGNVAVTRHAQDKMQRDGICSATFENVLFGGTDRPDGQAIWRERAGVRLVIVKPEPFRGAQLVVTVYRVTGQERSRR